jgi:Carbohydrate-selective porin, OprB family/S-layer homology domain
MTKRFWNILKFSPIIVASTFVAANSALAGEVNEQVTGVTQLSAQPDSMSQVTSVSQFSDVQPTDWAFQALQSLVERYGCIAGYPNGTYRGSRALTRYEFAAGLNACLDRVNELIATATADLVKKEDLATLQRLQEEFAAELATLRGRVDNLEARTAELEANQFSTTTKLQGEVIFNVSEAFGDKQATRVLGGTPSQKLESNTTFSDRVRLNLNSSFSGKDLLNIRLQARNTIANNTASLGSASTGTNMTRLSFDGDNGNAVEIDKISYAFNATDKVRVKIDASNAEMYANTFTYNPDLASDGRGSISRYGRFSPMYRQGQGGSALTVSVNPKGPITATVAYLAPNFATTTTLPARGSNDPSANSGVFNGDNTIFGELGFKPSDKISVGFSYARTYQGNKDGRSPGIFQNTGSTLANSPFGGGIATESNHYGVQASFQASKKLTVGGWFGYSNAQAATGAARGSDADMTYWAASLGLKDFGSKGNLLGILFGQPPKVTGNTFKPGGVEQRDTNTSYHLEGLYRMQLSDNIAVTPGLLVIFNPENNDKNNTIYVGTLRTTFTF